MDTVRNSKSANHFSNKGALLGNKDAKAHSAVCGVEASSHGEILCAVGIASDTRRQDCAARLALFVALSTLEGHNL